MSLGSSFVSSFMGSAVGASTAWFGASETVAADSSASLSSLLVLVFSLTVFSWASYFLPASWFISLLLLSISAFVEDVD